MKHMEEDVSISIIDWILISLKIFKSIWTSLILIAIETLTPKMSKLNSEINDGFDEDDLNDNQLVSFYLKSNQNF